MRAKAACVMERCPQRRRLASARLMLMLVTVETTCACTYEAADSGERTGEVSEAVVGSEITVASSATDGLSESFSFVVNASTWEVVVPSNAFVNGGQDTAQLHYGCTRDFYTWSQYWIPATNLGDPSGFYRSNGPAGSPVAYLATLNPDASGVIVYHSSDPCPSAGSATWSWWTAALGGVQGIDYPTALYRGNWHGSHDDMFVLYGKLEGPRPGKWHIHVLRFTADNVYSDYTLNCAYVNSDNAQFARGTFDYWGKLHLAFYDVTKSKIIHDTFDPSTNTFGCLDDEIGAFSRPPLAPSSCGCDIPNNWT